MKRIKKLTLFVLLFLSNALLVVFVGLQIAFFTMALSSPSYFYRIGNTKLTIANFSIIAETYSSAEEFDKYVMHGGYDYNVAAQNTQNECPPKAEDTEEVSTDSCDHTVILKALADSPEKYSSSSFTVVSNANKILFNKNCYSFDFSPKTPGYDGNNYEIVDYDNSSTYQNSYLFILNYSQEIDEQTGNALPYSARNNKMLFIKYNLTTNSIEDEKEITLDHKGVPYNLYKTILSYDEKYIAFGFTEFPFDCYSEACINKVKAYRKTTSFYQRIYVYNISAGTVAEVYSAQNWAQAEGLDFEWTTSEHLLKIHHDTTYEPSSK